jgi:hypothetical protein
MTLATPGSGFSFLRVTITLTCATLMMFVLINTAQAANFVVTSPYNQVYNGVCVSGGRCNLRQAIAAAEASPGADTISFAASLDGEVIQSPQFSMVITSPDSITINGRGINNTIISGFGSTNIFDIQAGTVTINDLKITGANYSAIKVSNSGTTFNLNRSRIAGNISDTRNGGGLSVTSGAVVTIRDSTFDANRSYVNGGAINIDSASVTNIINSTISGNYNDWSGLGGGIYVSSGSGTVNIINSTVTNNRSGHGGGVWRPTNSSTTVNIRNTIIAGNFDTFNGPYPTPDIQGNFVSQGFNLIGVDSLAAGGPSGFINGTNNDKVGTLANPINAQLLALADNGGSTPTHALKTDSPAIDAGNSSDLTTDQRGFTRPVDLADYTNAANGADIGAFEFASALPSIFSISGTVSYGITPMNQPQKFVAGVLLTTSDASVVPDSTDAGGIYLLENLTANGEYTVTPTKSGNVNGISPFDATMVLRHIAANGQGPNALNANQQIAADTNGDGSVTPFDATLILRYIAAGTSNANTGQVGNWKFNPVPRSYTPLNSSLSNQNYEAILIGEVSGDWNASASIAAEDDADAEKQDQETSPLTARELTGRVENAEDTTADVAAAKHRAEAAEIQSFIAGECFGNSGQHCFNSGSVD